MLSFVCTVGFCIIHVTHAQTTQMIDLKQNIFLSRRKIYKYKSIPNYKIFIHRPNTGFRTCYLPTRKVLNMWLSEWYTAEEFSYFMILGRIEMITEMFAIMNHSVYTPPRPMPLLLLQSFTLPIKFILMLPKNLFNNKEYVCITHTAEHNYIVVFDCMSNTQKFFVIEPTQLGWRTSKPF